MDSAAPEKGVYIATMGCQMNDYDSSRMEARLADLGYRRVERPEDADLVLINTCSVRERAEHKVYSLVGGLKDLKRRRPRLLIGVAGCVAQQEGGKLLEANPHLDLVLGTGLVDRLPELLDEAGRGRRQALVSRPRQPVATGVALPPQVGLKALVTVMVGCDNFCSYCVVPHVRGREQSRAAREVAAEAAGLVARGAREITLLGQNVNSYRDPETGADFAELLAQVAQVPELWRLRFTTSHPKDLSPQLIQAMATEPKVMEKLHLPAQSGSDRVLAAMNRGYTRQAYRERVAQLREMVPELALGGDIIVGFPGETEAEFQESLELLDEVRYDFLYSFKYSDRPFTKASRMGGKLDEKTKARRLSELQTLQRDISLSLHRQLEGSLQEVLVEGPAKKGRGLVTGRDRAGRAVNFSGAPALAGSLVRVSITEGRVNSLMGRLVEPPEGEEP
ncbi:MAG: tRNA (N6-isopentenyl adenosine(37)-C2)-methylthiotransferase MiaB [Deltaproteobacteria bacterium]|nr:tRNA (N6-isopentenyl adenosine(37)-C2)-methylthiotransferase MiaB [Deltaproteobacteria bacterium]